MAQPKPCSLFPEKSGNPQVWVQSKWEDLVLKFLIKTIEEVNDDEWNIQLGEEMCNQFQLYTNYPNYKSMLYKCIGVVLQRSSKKSFVRDKLDYMFNAVDHNKVEDRTVSFLSLSLLALLSPLFLNIFATYHRVAPLASDTVLQFTLIWCLTSSPMWPKMT